MSKDIAKSSARVKVSPFDDRLLSGAASGKSPVELSRSVGEALSPAECALRVREILQDKDFWNTPERKQLLMYRVQRVIDEMMDISSDSGDNQDYSTLIRAMDLLRKILGEMEGTTEEELRTLVRLQSEQMFDYVEAIMNRARDILADENPEFDPDTIDEAIALAREDVRPGV